MPKINVYLPDELASAVRAARLPVSAICQEALTEAVQRIGTARKGIEALRDPQFNPDSHPQFASRLSERMTSKLHAALALSRDAAAADKPIETRHLLVGILDERDNLAVRLLEALGHDVDELRTTAAQLILDEPLAAVPSPASGAPGAPSLWSGLTMPARIAIGAAVEASIELGHNYIGCEHLLVGLLTDSDSGAGHLLRGAGVAATTLRRSIASAAAGFAHARQSETGPGAAQLEQLIHRLDSIERRLQAASL